MCAYSLNTAHEEMLRITGGEDASSGGTDTH